MRRLMVSVLVALAVAGCSGQDSKPAAGEATAAIPTLTIEELEAQLAANACQAVDANGETTRKKMGVIPGAILLTDYDTFSSSELPADKSKTLVFYCANTHCGASHEAAKRARIAGHTSVKVLPDGIAGWVKAGKKVQAL